MTLPRPRHLKHFLDLPADQRCALAAAFALIPTFALAVRVLGFGPSHGWANAKLSDQPLGDDNRVRMGAHYARLVFWAARYGLWPGNCLSQSLTLCRLLRRRGIDARLRIGVRRAQGRMEAHAWIELDGTPLNDLPDVSQRFAPFAQLTELPSVPLV